MATPALENLLRVEYLQDELYTRALAAPVLLVAGSPARAAVELMQSHQAAHLARLAALGGAAQRPPADRIDLSGGASAAHDGPFAQALTAPAVFLRLAQLLEDTGVRACLAWIAKGGDAAMTELLAGILGTEARHAAMVRRLRNTSTTSANPTPWVSGVSAGAGYPATVAPAGGAHSQASIAQLVYGPATDPAGRSEAEDNTVQGVVDYSVTFLTDPTAAFDEPIADASLATFLALFLLP